MDSRPEILAPAGDMQQLRAAVTAGADAVYLGLKRFSARASAGNFDADELKEAVRYCRIRGVKVYAAVNTTLFDPEIDDARRALEIIRECGCDAVLVQDMAVAELLRDIPAIAMHASTQMSIHNASGARAASELGFVRVVPARELDLKEIAAVCSAADETEVFVHGALCVCVSGQCLLSSMLGGRSGNRGDCAGPCRLDWKCGGRRFALSLKDMSYIGRIRELADAGVCSLKIEGRLKGPEYAAEAVRECRAARDGGGYNGELLKNVFSRSGFTTGYLDCRLTSDMYGVRTEADKSLSKAAYSEIHEIYRAERGRVPLTFDLYCKEDGAVLTATDGCGNTAQARAQTVPGSLDENAVRGALGMTGGTPYTVGECRVGADGGVSIRLSAVKKLRREVLSKMDGLRGERVPAAVIPRKDPITLDALAPHVPSPVRRLRVRAENAGQLERIDADEYVLPLSEILSRPETVKRYGGALICELPELVFDSDRGSFLSDLDRLRAIGVTRVCAGNIGVIKDAGDAGFKSISATRDLNITNSVALEYCRRNLGIADAELSVETPRSAIESIKGETPRGCLVYGRFPLMKIRACPARGKNGCADCGGAPVLTDRRGIDFPMLCRGKKFTDLYNSVPFDIMDKRPQNTDFDVLYFTFETPEECARVAGCYHRRGKASPENTRGRY